MRHIVVVGGSELARIGATLLDIIGGFTSVTVDEIQNDLYSSGIDLLKLVMPGEPLEFDYFPESNEMPQRHSVLATHQPSPRMGSLAYAKGAYSPAQIC